MTDTPDEIAGWWCQTCNHRWVTATPRDPIPAECPHCAAPAPRQYSRTSLDPFELRTDILIDNMPPPGIHRGA